MKPEIVRAILDGVMAGMVILPQMVEQFKRLVRLYDRIENGEVVTKEEVDAIFDDIDARSGRIQDA